MTDKQIIEVFKNGFYCIEPCPEIKELQAELKRKEQEIEKAKQNAQDTYDLWQALIESFNILQGEKIKLEQENEELKKELESTKGLVTVGNRQLAEALKGYEELKKCYKNNSALLDFEETNTTKLVNKVIKLEKTLAEIKEIAYDGYNNGQTSYATFQCEKIINKINEVEGEKI